MCGTSAQVLAWQAILSLAISSSYQVHFGGNLSCRESFLLNTGGSSSSILRIARPSAPTNVSLCGWMKAEILSAGECHRSKAAEAELYQAIRTGKLETETHCGNGRRAPW